MESGKKRFIAAEDRVNARRVGVIGFAHGGNDGGENCCEA